MIRVFDNFFFKVNRIDISISHPFVILLSVSAYEIMKVALQIKFKSHGGGGFYDNMWTLSAVFGSTLLGFFSDRFINVSWRKPICLFGMVFALATGGTILLHPTLISSERVIFLTFFVLLNGISGSYLGAARAFYLDQFPGQKILHFSITVIAQCVPWICLGRLLETSSISSSFLYFLAPGFMLLAFFCTLFFALDKRTRKFEAAHPLSEIQMILKKYNHIKYWLIVVSFFLLSISYQLMPYLGERDFRSVIFSQEIFLLGVGVALGVPIAFTLMKTPTLRALQVGYGISFLYFLSIGILYSLGTLSKSSNLNYLFLVYAVLGGGLWILSLKEFLVKSKLTEDGLVLGFIESVQSLGEFLGAELATILSTIIFLKEGMNMWPFLLLTALAFLVVSIMGIVKRFTGA